MLNRSMPMIGPRLAQALAPALALSLLLYFGYHLVEGRYGLLALRAYEDALPGLRIEADGLAARRAALERRIAQLSPRHVDPDLLDEMARRRLGFVHPDERIAPMPAPRATPQP
ncbi:MAG: FtsB family cell division protein [Pseudomonadota bacterium]|jgi:cell division protein FtsB